MLGDGLGRALVIAGGHDDGQALVLQGFEGVGRRRLDAIRHGNETSSSAVDGEKHYRVAGRLACGDFIEQGLNLHPKPLHQRKVPKGQRLIANGAGNALPDHGRERAGWLEVSTAILCAAHNGFSQRVFGAVLQTACQSQNRHFLKGRQGVNVGQAWFPLSQGARLVDHDRIDHCEGLQRLGVLDQHANLRAASGGCGDGYGRSEAQSARTGDDEHGHRRHKSKGQRRLRTDQKPDHERQNRRDDNSWHKEARNTIRQRLTGRAAQSGSGDQTDDLSQHGLLADLGGFDGQGASLVERAAGDQIIGMFGHGNRLTRNHAFVHGRSTIDDPAIDRNTVAGPHAQAVAGEDILQRRIVLAAIGQNPSRGRWREVEQTPDRVARPLSGAQFKHLAEEDQRNDDHGALVVSADAVTHAHLLGKDRRQEGCDQ